MHVSVGVCVLFEIHFQTPNTKLALLDNTTINSNPPASGNLREVLKDEKQRQGLMRETRQSATHTNTHTLSVGACPGCYPGSQAPSVLCLCDLAGNNIEISSPDLLNPVLWSRLTHTTQVLF